jgi:hypothetical protein
MLILGELKAYCLNFRLKGPIISGPQNPQLLTHIAAADITGCYKSLSDISALQVDRPILCRVVLNKRLSIREQNRETKHHS